MVQNNFFVKITPVAYEDLEEIYRYITFDLFAENAEEGLLQRIEKTILQLRHFPYSGSYLTNEFLRNKGYRKLVIENYIVFYIIDEKNQQVIIMRALYGRQMYEELL